MFEGCADSTIARLMAIFIPMAFAFSAHAQVSTITVDSIGDQGLSDPSSINCVSTVSDCTLRSAIQAANNRPGQIIIQFDDDIPTNFVNYSIINLGSPLPEITSTVILAGESHPGYDETSGTPGLLINGAAAGVGNTAHGLRLGPGSPESIIRHLSIYNFAQSGISISAASNMTIEGNYIGLNSLSPGIADTSGNAGPGLFVRNSSNNIIENNWIGDNALWGILVADGSANNVLAGNRVGLRPTGGGPGVAAAGNGFSGIQINADAGSGNQIGRCVFSGFNQTCTGNVVAANGVAGIRLLADGQSVRTNWIGVTPEDPTSTDFGNSGHGILIESNDNVISTGLSVTLTANVIGNNGSNGISLADDASNNQIFGARIGVDPSGNDVGNTGAGVSITSGDGNSIGNCRIENNVGGGVALNAAGNNVIGNEIIANEFAGVEVGSAPVTIGGNVIGSHTLAGIIVNHSVPGQFATIRENHIGVRPDGSNIANARGILVGNGPARIGDTNERGNVIGFNTFAGIEIDRADTTSIRSNYIGRTPNNDVVGNNGPGIFITSNVDGGTSLSALIGYQPGAEIPFNPIPDGSGSGGVGNIIAHNTVGVLIDSENDNVTLERHLIRGNSIFDNTDGGIQLGSSIGDIDPGGNASGPNTLLNHPQLDDGATWLDASTNPHTLHFRYRVPTSTDNAAYPLRIDFYSTYSGQVQGRSWVGSDEYSASDAGQWRSGTLTPQAGVLTTAFGGSEIVAKTIDADRNTSEFSAESANVTTQGDPQPNELLVTANTDEPNQDPNSAICNTGQPEVAPAVAHCTLRAALQAASNFSDTAVIEFWENIPHGNGVTTFQPETPLPPVTGSTEIAGETHPFFSTQTQRPQIIIRNDLIDETPEVSGLRVLDAQGASIRFVAVTEAARSGIEVGDSSHVSLRGNLVGLVPDGGQNIPAGNDSHGIAVWSSTNIVIESNRIAANGNDGIRLGTDVTNSLIFANQIGVAESGAGLVAVPNGQNGIFIDSSAGNGNQIGQCVIDPVFQCIGNLIGASDQHGIRVSSDGNSLASNVIGFNPANPADEDFGLGSNGIFIDSDGNTISGLSLDANPGIIGNASADAIQLSNNASNNTISNLLIGVDGQGNDIGNGGAGIRVFSGGNNLISQNRIANNGQPGISITADVGPNEIEQNEILDNHLAGIFTAQGGQDIDGNIIGGSSAGIWMQHDFIAGLAGVVNITNNFIGVTPDGEDIGNVIGIVAHEAGFANIGLPDRGNVIANNGFGVRLDRTSGNFVQSNHIGVLPDGTPAGNSNGGVIITSTEDNGEASDNTVGFQATVPIPFGYEPEDGGPGNIIAHNGVAGVLVFSSFDNTTLVNNSIRGNRFYANTGQAIDLGPDGDTIDPGGGETGPNNLQNFPVFNTEFTQYDEDQDLLFYAFSVNTSPANATYPLLVDLYIADGNTRQGKYFLTTAEYQDFDAPADMGGSLTPPAGLNLASAYLVATATDSDGNTSQFSAPLLLGDPVDEIFHDRFEEAQE